MLCVLKRTVSVRQFFRAPKKYVKTGGQENFIFHPKNFVNLEKVSKVAKIRNRYNQVPHLTQDTNGKVTNSQNMTFCRFYHTGLVVRKPVF